MSEPIQIHDESIGGREVRWIELTRENKANALSIKLLQKAAQAIKGAPEKAILISSRGNSFSGGLDLDEILDLRSAKKPLKSLIRLYKALLKHPSPTACLVAQRAAAGGVGLALCADTVVMTCNAWFTLPGADIYRPLAEVLFPIVKKRRGITEQEFEKWYGQKITAGELEQRDYIDRVVHHKLTRPSTGNLKQAAVRNLQDKGLYPVSNLGDRLDLSVYQELSKREKNAGDHSETGQFKDMLRISQTKIKQVFKTTVKSGGSADIFAPVNSNVEPSIVTQDFSTLEKLLLEHGVQKADVSALQKALKLDSHPTEKDQFGPKVSSWIGGMVKKAANGSWDIGLGAAGALLAQAIAKYYGL